MKLFKKIISIASALAMVSSIAVATTAHAAQGDGDIKLNATLASYNEADGTGTIDISVAGMDTLLTDVPGGMAQLITLGIDIYFDTGAFDETYYSGNSALPISNISKNIPSNMGSITRALDPQGTGAKMVRIGFADASSTVFADQKLFSFNFKVTDPSVENKISIKDTLLGFFLYDSAGEAYGGQQSYVQNEASMQEGYGLITYSGDTVITEGGDIEIVIPPATGATATGDQLLNLKPSDIGLEGDEWTTEDPAYADEKAVVSLANVKKDDAITGFTWEIKAADAEGNPLEQTTKYFAAGNIESAAEVTVGLVVGYDTTEWQSVEIVGVTAE
ncbi:MAG TPA: hypothetical protein IAA60_06045 [Candidatus Ornithomonoglobus intestinigallinarum]|uniref:Uncharacterized protein n=1 Tax=Candidatus Ornithomonoglobus intestinigallinarum TaxID=2840894 RepID=A0A9D1H3H8_9FIRM|nr:hypothetical protein [Candidatus Ornithomonoglobus intestinigallinarum]